MIVEIVRKAIKEGCVTPSMAASLLRALDGAALIDSDPEEIEALARLQTAVREGRVVTHERKRCFNIMEELVWQVLEEEFSNLRTGKKPFPDAGDVAAYALNHLRPLYAVSEEGAEFQRKKAREELWELVRKRVREALEHSLGQPVWHPERKPLAPQLDKDSLVTFLEGLLRNAPAVQ